MEGPRAGVTSEATQHCCESNCHNIHYHDQEDQTVKERHLVASKLSSKRNKYNQVERTAQFSCKRLRLKASYPVHAKLTTGDTEGLPRQCLLCRRPQLPPFDAIDATWPPSTPSTPPGHHRRHRRHHHRRHRRHRRHRSHRCHPSHQFLPFSNCTLL